jgi:hypothetical protein
MISDSYEERYCLFLDILGFQSHIDETVKPSQDTKRAMTFQKLRAALRSISEGVQYKDGIEVAGEIRPTSRQVSQFSDCVVVSYLKSEPYGTGVTSILLDVHRLQLDLVRRGILLRGAISAGLLFHDKDLVFGPALNEAVALEKLANYPRVILDSQVLDDAGLRGSARAASNSSPDGSISSMVAEDFDGLYYIDYINVHSQDFGDDWSDLREYLECLRNVVKGLANKKSPSIRVKHSWLRTKFNAMSAPLQKANFRKLGGQIIPDEEAELFHEVRPF